MKIIKINSITPVQSGMLFQYMLTNNKSLYMGTERFDFEGNIDMEAFEAVLADLSDKYEIFRTNIIYEKLEEPKSVVLDKRKIPFRHFETNSSEEKNRLAEKINEECFEKGFDLQKDALFKIYLIQTNGDSTMLFSFHHILLDGYCAAMIADIIMNSYGRNISKENEYVPFSVYQDWLKKQNISESRRYWDNLLSNVSDVHKLELVQFSSDRDRNNGYLSMNIEFSEDETKKLSKIAADNHTTLNIYMQWLWGLTLCRNFSAEKVSFGTVAAYRPAEMENSEKILGPMINTIPVVFSYDNNESIGGQLWNFSRTFVESMANSWIGLGEIQKSIPDCENIIDHLFVYDNFPEMDFRGIEDSTGFKIKDFCLEERTEYPLTLEVSKPDNLRIRFSYDSSIYSGESIKRLAALYKTICINSFDAEKPSEIKNVTDDFKIRTEHEKEKVRASFKSGSLSERFAYIAKNYADKPAIEFNGKILSFKETDELSDRLAWYLKNSYGISEGERIAIDITSSIEVIISILAIIKLGCCYVPFDLLLPEKRLESIIEDASPAAILIFGEKTKDFSIKSINISLDELENISVPSDAVFRAERNTESAADIMFTSGTTAKPKGVIIKDGGILGLTVDPDFIDYSKISCQFQDASIAFDATLYEIWSALLNGKKLVVIDRNTLLSVDRFAEMISENKNCSIFLTTTLFNNFVSQNPEIFRDASYVTTGGEKFSEYHGKKFLEACPDTILLNAYGPTESTTYTTCFKVTRESVERTVPVGKPINTRGVFICDNNGELLPDGSVGEIVIYGQGLALGYCGDEKLTASKFITLSDGTKIYKTGDYGYRQDDGNICFISRFDDQLKIRGFRISTDEIEAALRDCNDIVNAAVKSYRGSNGMFLAAYIVTKDGISLKECQSRITEELGKILPYYMIPSEFIQMDSLPVNHNGKLDKSMLKEPQICEENFTAPETETEKKIYDAFRAVITDRKFGMDSSFIKLGGDSISAMKLTAILRKNGFNITVADLYREQTPARLAVYADSGKTEVLKDIVPDTKNRYERFPLNNVQVAYLSGRSKDLVLGGYGTAFFSETSGDYDCVKFTEALNTVIKRHDMLRAVIYDNGTQQILRPDEVEYKISETDISKMDKAQQNEYLEQKYKELRNTVFEIGKWPMFTMKAFRTAENNVHIMYAFDAVIMDASSVIMLAAELEAAYSGKVENEELELSFRDYILESAKKTDEFEKDKKYWLEKVNDFPSAPAIKFRTPPENLKSPEFGRKHMKFSNEVWEKIRKSAAEMNITPAILLCGLYSYALSLYSGQSKLAVNLTVFSREQIHRQVDKILGDFTKIVLLDYDFADGSDFKTILSESHKRLNDYLAHLYFDGIDFMRELSRVQKTVNGRPLMPIVFTSALFDSGNVKLAYDFEKSASRTPQVYLDCQAMLRNGELHIVWDYPCGLYDEKLLDSMFRCFTGFISDAWKINDSRFPKNPDIENFYAEYNNTHWEHRKLTLQNLVKESLYNPSYSSKVWIYSENGTFTYEQTRREAEKYAAYLQSQGTGCGDFVCVEGERTPETLFMILGTVLCGAAYIPVQPSWPDERKNNIIINSGCKCVLKSGTDISGGNFEFAEAAENAPAYVIYTSGSTGKPKGVLINQSAVTNTILDINDRYKICAADVFAAVSSFSFDLSVYDIFGSLNKGAGISLIRDMKNINSAVNQLSRDNVTVWNTVPALMELLTENIVRKKEDISIPLRLVLLSGDWIPVQLPENIRSCFKTAKTVSLGGATEASVWSIAYDIDENMHYDVHIPYGYPLRNQHMYVLGENLEPLPENVEGDIYIGGDGTADGYQNAKELTDAAFIDHYRFGRIYRTGDSGYISEKGWMEFCGRKDFQVKLNGLRIELGDIDSNILKTDGISDSVSSVIRNDSGSEYLCTYVKREQVISDETEITDIPYDTMKKHENRIISAFDLESYRKINSLLEEYCISCMAETLQKLGISAFSGMRITPDEICRKLNISENRYKNFRQWFTAMKNKNIISMDSGIFMFYPEKAGQPDSIYERLTADGIPDYISAAVGYVIKIRENLPDILLGKVDPMAEIFFKDGNMQNGINVYRNSIIGKVYGSLAAELTKLLAEKNSGKTFRILEVGAGVGGTTDYIIENIKSMSDISYTFTDLSDVFLDEARKRYKDCDFVDYRIFDINKHPRIQDMPLHSFDLIIGANVFHDAHNIDSVMEEMQLLLADNGMLMIIEATVNTAAQMITAGFIEGLTAYEDDRLKTDLPAYSEQQWKNSVVKGGYTNPVMFPQNDESRKILNTSLILTRTRLKGSIVDETDIINRLREKIPDYMIPKFIIEMQKFPLTDNGKLDMKKLPVMNIEQAGRNTYEKPETELQKKLCGLWEENLGIGKIGITDNYFTLGGDSLKAIRLMSRIEEEGYTININSVFHCTTVKDMAEEIEKTVK